MNKGRSCISKFLKVAIIALFVLCAFKFPAFAEDLTTMSDKFYNGLADTIQRNMNNPERCVKEVDKYYDSNRSYIIKIREITEKHMKEAMAMMDKYENMTAAEMEAMSKKMEKNMVNPHVSKGAEKYGETMEKFATKHPQYGFKIAMKAKELMPQGGSLAEMQER